MNKKLFQIFSIIAAFSLIITACSVIGGQPAPTASADQLRATADAMDAPAATSAGPVATPGSVDARALRLLSADANYRSQGAAAWARQLGYGFDSLTMEARQPEEETFSESATEAMTVVSGIQVRVTNLKAHSPSCFTTDQKVSGVARWVKPDNFDPISNPSVLYTDNETGFSGTATLWGDCSNWRNLMEAPLAQLAAPAVPAYIAPATAATAMPALTMADLEKLGRVIQRLYYPENVLAGAQIEFSTAWTAPSGWTIQKNGSNVTSVTTGDVASVWSPENLRPLAEN